MGFHGRERDFTVEHVIITERNRISQQIRTGETGACTGFLKGVGEESARSAGFEATAASEQVAAGVRGRSPRNFLTELYAKPIGLRISIQKVQSS